MDHLNSIDQPYPSGPEGTIDLSKHLSLPPASRELERICNRLSAELDCEAPPTAERMDWTKLSDLYSFYLSNARAEVSRL